MIAPFNLPFNFSSAAVFVASTKTTGAVIDFLSPGDHALGYAFSAISCGSTTWAENFSSVQPLPNGPHASRCAFSRPHDSIFDLVHSLARFICGEPVKRGP